MISHRLTSKVKLGSRQQIESASLRKEKNVVVKKLRGSKWCKCIRLRGVISGPVNATEAK